MQGPTPLASATPNLRCPVGGTGRIPALSLLTNLTGKLRPGTEPYFTAGTPLNDPGHLADNADTDYRFGQNESCHMNLSGTAPLRDGFRMKTTADCQVAATHLLCLSGAFSDIYGNATDSTNYRFSVATDDDYGNITVSLKGYEGDVIVQLVADRDKVVRESFVKSPGDVVFLLLDKGKYRLKAVYDLDSNRVWTTGDFNILRGPEPVSYYPGELEVKINWELEAGLGSRGQRACKDVSIRSKPVVKR
ncbi:MAG: hypothetical protein MZV63_37525 [Marinilabiliales bacterium]|nr:hypothetical protein [Marinilabiliales bacterium]